MRESRGNSRSRVYDRALVSGGKLEGDMRAA